MKLGRVVLFTNSLDNGGASRVAIAQFKHLLDLGLDVFLVVTFRGKSTFSHERIVVVSNSVFSASYHRAIWFFTRLLTLSFFIRSSRDIRSLNIFPTCSSRTILSLNPEIVHLHWINKESMSLFELRRFKCKVYWTMHDYWPLQILRHLPLNNNTLNVAKWNWLFTKALLWKISFYPENLVFISPSESLKRSFSASILSKSYQCICINNGVEIPEIDSNDARLSTIDGMVITVGAANYLNDTNKGFKYFIELVELLRSYSPAIPKIKITFNVIGCSNLDYFDLSKDNIKIRCLGNLKSVEVYKVLVNSNFFILTSEFENLSTLAIESLLCGTPVIAFNVGGNSEIICSEDFGILVEPFDVHEIMWQLQKSFDSYPFIRNVIMETNSKRFSIDNSVNGLLELYSSDLLKNLE